MTSRGVRRGFRVLTAALLVLLGGPGCGAPDATRPAETGAGPTAPEVSVRLDAEARRRAGIEVAEVSPDRLLPEALAYGRVLDPAPVREAAAALDVARIANAAAQRELERVVGLARGHQNASQREVEVARAGAARARADLELAEMRIAASLGGGVPDLALLAQRIGRRQAALVRVDVPAGRVRPLPEQGARLEPYPQDGGELVARYLGPAPDSDPMLPGWGFLFLVPEQPPPVGTPVRAHLRLPGPPLSGVRVPASAMVRHEGHAYVFVEHEAGGFERRAVAGVVGPDGAWFVSEGLSPGERIVVGGAQELLSAELLGAGGSAAGD